MSNLVTLPTMRFRRAPETRNLFATRRLYIYYHCQFYRSVSTSSTRFHRGKSCYRCYNRPSPYPKVTSKQQTPPPSVFIDSCRGNDTLYFPLSPHHRFDESSCRANGIFLTVRKKGERSSFRETSCRPRASRKPVDRSRFDFKHEEKRGGGKKAERKRATGSQRRRETVRFASRSERFRGCEITCNCVPRETIVQRKVTARADKKGAQLAPFSVRERTVFPLLSFSRTCPPFIFRPSEIKFYIHRP